MIHASDYPFHNFIDWNIEEEMIPFVLKAPPPFLSTVQWSSRDKPLPGKPGVMRTIPKVGRNDLCQCGSGKKYKKCCLLSPEQPKE